MVLQYPENCHSLVHIDFFSPCLSASKWPQLCFQDSVVETYPYPQQNKTNNNNNLSSFYQKHFFYFILFLNFT